MISRQSLQLQLQVRVRVLTMKASASSIYLILRQKSQCSPFRAHPKPPAALAFTLVASSSSLPTKGANCTFGKYRLSTVSLIKSQSASQLASCNLPCG